MWVVLFFLCMMVRASTQDENCVIYDVNCSMLQEKHIESKAGYPLAQEDIQFRRCFVHVCEDMALVKAYEPVLF